MYSMSECAFEALEKHAIDAKRKRWLAFHDQKTAGIMGLLPLVKGLPVRLTNHVNHGLQLYKNRRCTIEGWTLHADEDFNLLQHVCT